jgi:hypothetical protein
MTVIPSLQIFCLKENVQQLSARAVCCDVLFKFRVLYILLLHLSVQSADRLSLAPSAVAYSQIVIYIYRAVQNLNAFGDSKIAILL